MNHNRHGKLLSYSYVSLFTLGVILFFAASVYAVIHLKFEAETGIITGQASVSSDSLASSGQYLSFNSASGPTGKKCIVNLHGKGGDGGPSYQDGDTTWIFPTGNGDGGGWGPHHWEYSTSTTYSQALSIINSSIASENCGQIVLIGFSNGASMAAKVYCQGQNFSNRLLGVIVDDPVPDRVVDNCAPASNLQLRLIQSDDMGWITDGTPCPGGWTCQGTLYGRATYQSRIGAVNTLIKSSHIPSNEVYPTYFGTWWR
jgi:hypothetical protein